MGFSIEVLWIVGAVNAYNFMDGIDSLAAIIAVVGGIGWWCLGTAYGASAAGILGACTAAGALGFLALNWPPAKIFMGDAGSTALGFIFGANPLIAFAQTHRPGFLFAGAFLWWPMVADSEPIVCAPAEAIDCYLRTKMDVLVIGSYFCRKAAG